MEKVTVNVARLVQLQDLLKQARTSFTTRVSLLNIVIEEIDSIITERPIEPTARRFDGKRTTYPAVNRIVQMNNAKKVGK